MTVAALAACLLPEQFQYFELAAYDGVFADASARNTRVVDGACIFLEGQDCKIQPVKPQQCRGFPNAWNFPGWREVCEATEI